MKHFGYALFLIFAIQFSSIAQEEKPGIFRDTLDNALDISRWFRDYSGFLPVIMPITEPAVGFGAVGAGVFLMPKKGPDGEILPPDVLGVGGGLTENGTWVAGGMYNGYWFDDKIRFKFQGGYGNVVLNYYSNDLPDESLEFTLGSLALMPSWYFRIKETPFLMGFGYQYLNTNIDAGLQESELPNSDLSLVSSGLSLNAEYDQLDNRISPTAGFKVHAEFLQNFELIGSDRNFSKLTAYSHIYMPITKKWIPAVRIETIKTFGDVPFYSEPFLKLRGVPAMRYQGELTALVEMENYVGLTSRWGLVGFAGYGQAFVRDLDTNQLTKSTSAWNVGAGFRYLIARLYGMKSGIDIARGPEEWAIYVTIGSGWSF